MTFPNSKKLSLNVGRNTIEVRKANELSFPQLASVSGVSRRTLQRIEKARKDKAIYVPKESTITKLANLVGVTPQEFAGQKLAFQ
jgi:transcriptional regulator with XRE-family HTH domain